MPVASKLYSYKYASPNCNDGYVEEFAGSNLTDT